ncbi:unnamed protein product [Bemisia tabaci]|uniref:Bax inhibitor 1 n=1 Tax=Bemisia tabaci TaxID=7038 RepID=A0A9N9ZZD2_BEMTA|nr:PREDICTED: probable Bax inhibitor 1 [Bemisia tabaci]CAH0381000.1 unnamed protein product [Bemisia tabaci]
MPPTVESFLNSFTRTLDEPVRDHLKNVYACLSLSLIVAAAGAYVHMFTEILSASFLTVLATTGLLLTLLCIPDNDKNRNLRIGLLLGIAFFSGMGMGPLLEIVVQINPQIVMTSFIGTAVLFGCFSAAALTARRGQWLYLGGTLMTMLASLIVLSLANIFLGSQLIFQAYLYLGLLIMCGFVLYDTQLIIEKRLAGDKDFVTHSIDLFIDFIGIFRRLMVILSQKEEQSRKKKD